MLRVIWNRALLVLRPTRILLTDRYKMETSMALADGYHDVPAGKLAAVVTYLEMRAAPDRAERSLPEGVEIHLVKAPDVQEYLNLFDAVGQQWLWAARLRLDATEIAATLRHPDVELWVLKADWGDAGILELDFRTGGECELTYFGLVPRAIGQGLGQALLEHGISRAFARDIGRFWLHTCTLDSPGALGFYRKMGFVPYARKIEVFDDPRLAGLLPRDAADRIPVI